MKWTAQDERELRDAANNELIDVCHFSLGRMTKLQQEEFLRPRREAAKREKAKVS